MGPMSDVQTGQSVERMVELGLDRDELWALIATPEGWRDWLVDDARLVDGAGVVVDGGVTRHVRVDEVREGSTIGFTWWEDGDPASISHVRLTIDEGRLQIIEQLLAPAQAAAAKLAWEVRVCSLWACTVAAALV
jgi:uncharacterized protein YndB with AHSA1/START domain